MLLVQNNLAAQQQTAEFAKLLQGTKYEISNITENYPLRIPITLEPNVKAIKVFVVGVSLGNRNYQHLTKAFKVDMEKVLPSENILPAILVTVDAKDLEQGEYQVLLSIQPEGAEDNLKKQSLNLQLTLPPAKIQQPGTLTIEQTIFPFGAATVGNPTLLLLETSGHQTRLDNILAKQIAIAAENNRSTSASISLTPPVSLEPGKAEETKISLLNEFPLGTTKGTILIKSPQMAESILIPFEVKASRHWGYIITFIVLGLIAGFGVRTWAQREIDLHNARQSAKDTIKKLEQELQQHPDSSFAEKIAPVITKVKNAENSSKIEDIKTTIDEAKTQLVEALKDLDTRRAEAQNLIKNLIQSANARQSLPREFSTIFDIKSSLDKAQQEIKAENIVAAHQTLGDLIVSLKENINDTLANWKSDTESVLTELGNISPLAETQALDEKLTQKITNLSASLNEISSITNLTVEEINTIIGKLSGIQLKIKEFLQLLQALIIGTTISLKAQFNAVLKKDEESINKLFAKLSQFQNKPADWVEFSSKKMEEVKNEIIVLKKIWKEATAAQLKEDETIKVEVENLFAEEKFREATLKVIKYLLAIPKDNFLGKKSKEETASLAASLSEDIMLVHSSLPANIDLITSDFIKVETQPPVFDVFKTGSPLNFTIARFIRFLIAGIGIVAIGYVLFADKFVGTISDLLAIFVWAFGIDLTVNAFIEAGGKLKR